MSTRRLIIAALVTGLAILVAVDEPEGDVFGGSVAAPAWSAIAAEGLRQIGVLPDTVREEIALASVARDDDSAGDTTLEEDPPPRVAPRSPGQSVVPDLAGLPARSAVRRLAEAALEPELRGSGRTVSQFPRPGAVVKRGARVRVTLAPSG